MDLKTNSNINFKGAFVFKAPSAEVKTAIPDIIKKGRQIFYNIKNDGDVVIVTKDKYDKRIKDFIEETGSKFEYYPEISTKSGLDDEIPSGLKKLIQLKDNCVITNLKTLNRFLNNSKIHLSKQIEYLQQAMNTLRLNIENTKISINDKNLFVIRDEAKNRTIKSTGFVCGNAYVHIIPDSLNEEAKRYLIGQNGKSITKEYTSPKDIIAFMKIFKKAGSEG